MKPLHEILGWKIKSSDNAIAKPFAIREQRIDYIEDETKAQQREDYRQRYQEWRQEEAYK